MTDTTTSVLNNLIETLKDGQLGYTTAAEDAARSDLKALFHEYAVQRAAFAAKLQHHVEAAGEDAEEDGSIAGDLHRGWINLKSAVSAREDLAILEECERGEDSAVANYRKALASAALGAAKPIVEQQFTAVKAAHDRVKQLRDSMKHDAPQETVLI